MGNLEEAIKYSEMGYSVIPLAPGSKDQPLVKWTEYQNRKATKEEIISWWTKTPTANIAIVTGKISGICVADHDKYKPEYSEDDAIKYFPDTLVTPTAYSPRGGMHMYFKCPDDEISGKAEQGGLRGIDFRCEGNYIVVPPSSNGNGKQYKWELNIFDIALMPLPEAYLKKLNSTSSIYNKNYLRGGCCHNVVTTTTTDNIDNNRQHIFESGVRDENLFHIANCLAKTGNSEEYAKQVLLSIMNSWGEHDEKWAIDKIKSAFSRIERKDRNFTEDVREYCLSTTGWFMTTDVQHGLQVTTREEKKKLTVSLLRLVSSNMLEKHSTKNGCFRLIESDADRVNFMEAPTEEFDIKWPFYMENFVKIFPGNIVMIAGSKESGKTSFLLNIARENLGKHKIVYLNSEMGDTEFRSRLELFQEPTLETWAKSMDAYHRHDKFQDLINGDKCIYIIDFLEVYENFSEIAGLIRKIHQKLKDGICIIAIQKAQGAKLGRGADFSAEKARLYLSLEYDYAEKDNKCEIVYCKAWKGTSPRNKVQHYKITRGSWFTPLGDWR